MSYEPKYNVGDMIVWKPAFGLSEDVAAKITKIDRDRYCYVFIRHDRRSCIGKTSSFPFEALEELTRLIPSPSKIWADLNDDRT